MSSLRLTTSLQQKMVLTPQLRQRIEMLQMTSLELSELIQQEMVANPVLEEVQSGEEVKEISDNILDQLAQLERVHLKHLDALPQLRRKHHFLLELMSKPQGRHKQRRKKRQRRFVRPKAITVPKPEYNRSRNKIEECRVRLRPRPMIVPGVGGTFLLALRNTSVYSVTIATIRCPCGEINNSHAGRT